MKKILMEKQEELFHQEKPKNIWASIPPQTQRQATKILAQLMHQYFHPQNGSMRGGADDE